MTAAEIQGRILARVADEGGASATAAETLQAINEGQELAALMTLCLETTASWTLTATTAWYSARAAFNDYLCPLRLMVGSTRVSPASIRDLDARDAGWQASAGTPARYATLGFSLFAVTPQPAIDTAASLTYARTPVELVGDAWPEIPEAYHQALVDYGVYRVRLKDGAQNLERGLRYFGRFLEAMKELGDQVRARSRAAGYDTLPFEVRRFDMSRLTQILKRKVAS